MSWACASSISLLATGMVEAQRGRTPQFPFMKSSASSAVVFGSIVAGLSSGTGGGLTLDHSVVMSFAPAGSAANAAAVANRMAQPSLIACFIVSSFRSDRRHGLDLDQEIGTVEPRHLDQRDGGSRRRADRRKEAIARLAIGRELAHVAEKHGQLHQIARRAADRLQRNAEILEDLRRLRREVALADHLARA